MFDAYVPMTKVNMIEDESARNFLNKTVKLKSVFVRLGIHPSVGVKVFVKNAPVVKQVEVEELAFYGMEVKIYRMQSLNADDWRVDRDMARKIECIYKTMNPYDKTRMEKATDVMRKIEESSTEYTKTVCDRTLLKLYLGQTLTFEATIAGHSVVRQTDGRRRLRICMRDVCDPDTKKMYSDHNNVLIPDDYVKLYATLPVGTTVEFQGTVQSYTDKRTGYTKYGVRLLSRPVVK